VCLKSLLALLAPNCSSFLAGFGRGACWRGACRDRVKNKQKCRHCSTQNKKCGYHENIQKTAVTDALKKPQKVSISTHKKKKKCLYRRTKNKPFTLPSSQGVYNIFVRLCNPYNCLYYDSSLCVCLSLARASSLPASLRPCLCTSRRICSHSSMYALRLQKKSQNQNQMRQLLMRQLLVIFLLV
jgi:hypothetical protein